MLTYFIQNITIAIDFHLSLTQNRFHFTFSTPPLKISVAFEFYARFDNVLIMAIVLL